MAKIKQEDVRKKSPTREVAQGIHSVLESTFGEAVELVDAVDPYTVIKDAEKFMEIMTFLRDDERMQFNFLRSVTGVDWPDEDVIDSVYHLYSYSKSHAHVVKYRCPRAEPEIYSVESLWPTANWFERESYDLLGILYLGHSDLRRIMLPDDWEGHPLRKDYAEAADYRGIGTTRASPLDAFAQMDKARAEAREARGEETPAPIQSAIQAPDADKEDGDATVQDNAASKGAE